MNLKRYRHLRVFKQLRGSGAKRKPGERKSRHASLKKVDLSAELFESRERWRATFENTAIGIGLSDPQGHLLEANTKFLHLFGYTSDELTRLTIDDLAYPADQAASRIFIREMLEGKRTFYQYEKRYVRKTRDCFWGRINASLLRDKFGKPKLIVGVIEDITERKETEEKLKKSEEKFRRLVENIEEKHFIYTHDPDGVFTYLSSSITEILGYTPEEFFTHYSRYLTAHPINAAVEKHTQLSIQGVKQPSYEVEIYHKNGSIIWLEVSETPVFGENGEVVAVQGIAQDITARKKAEEERRKIQNQMQHVQKLESLGILAGGIAHDFNNILLAILGNAEMAMHNLPGPSPIAKNLSEISKAATHAADLAQQMLAYSGKGGFEVKALELRSIINSTAEILKVSVPRKITLHFNLTDQPTVILADGTQISQVIMNLVINAFEAIGNEAGLIGITTGIKNYDREFLSQTWLNENLPPGKFVSLQITDSGCGMDPGTLAKIFDPFFTTKFTGRGLGLPAVLGIIRGHKGALKVTSEPGKGTTFLILLPASEESPEISGREAAQRPPGTPPPTTILLADDEDFVRGITKEMLESMGYQVLTAANGKEAVDLVNDRGDDIGCVILDITMPVMDGEEAFLLIRKNRVNLPVLLSSGYSEEDISRRFSGKGFTGFIEKPYNLKTLKEKIRKAMDKTT